APYATPNAAAAINLCACAVVSSRCVSARSIRNRPFPINFRCTGKRHEYPDRHVHGKSVLRPGSPKNASPMEVCSQPGMASDCPSDFQNKVTKTQTAVLGFRVKSGWAAVVLLTRPANAPQIADVNRVELADPRLPETRQPYHASTGKLESDFKIVNRREGVVRCITQQSLGTLLTGYGQKGYRISRAALIVGSQIDPASIANAHIR